MKPIQLKSIATNPNVIFILPFFINLFLMFTPYWGFAGNFYILLILNILFLGIGIYILRIDNNSSEIFKEAIRNFIIKRTPYIYALQLLLFVILPIRNLNYGDGILLLENILLEGSVFGFQVTLDEFLEGFLHSFLFQILEFEDPRTIYQLLSTLGGFFYLFLCIAFYREIDSRRIYFLTPGVLLLFYGYAENYTLVTILVFVSIHIGGKWIQENKDESSILLLALLATISASFHLVYGYMGLALIYFSWNISKSKSNFIKFSIYSSIIGGVYFAILFGYFLFFSDPTISPSQTHILSPPIYPWKRWISMNHFKEMLGVYWFTSMFSGIVVVTSFFIDKEKFNTILNTPKTRFILLAVIGFFLHAFFHNPSLGFPADWDLFSFYSLPLLLLTLEFYPIWKKNELIIMNLAMYSILFHISTAYQLSTNPQDNERDYIRMINLTKQYIQDRSSMVAGIDRNSKKMYLKLDHFLYKSKLELESYNSISSLSDSVTMIEEVETFKKEMEYQLSNNNGKLEKPFLKDFLTRLTEFHHRLILVRREEKKYHPGM